MRRPALWTVILLWLAGILFPLAFLGSLWPDFGRVFNVVFAPGWMHILMHGSLYAVLGFLLALGIKPRSARDCTTLAGLILLTGCLQEALQLLTAGIWPGLLPELFDITVDLGGAALGVGLWWTMGRMRKRRHV